MTQLSGVFAVEVDLRHLAEHIADEVTDAVVEPIAEEVIRRLRAAAREATGGSATYERPAEPDPGAGGRRGVAGFGDVTDDGLNDQTGE